MTITTDVLTCGVTAIGEVVDEHEVAVFVEDFLVPVVEGDVIEYIFIFCVACIMACDGAIVPFVAKLLTHTLTYNDSVSIVRGWR